MYVDVQQEIEGKQNVTEILLDHTLDSEYFFNCFLREEWCCIIILLRWEMDASIQPFLVEYVEIEERE